MLYQIQLYDPKASQEENQKPENRSVHATVDGLATQDEISKWQIAVLEENPVPEGKASFVVAENSPLFIRQDGTLGVLGTDNVEPAKVKETGQVALLNIQECLSRQTKIDEQRRLAEIDRQQKLAAHMAAFKA